jgi:hypothetical protein
MLDPMQASTKATVLTAAAGSARKNDAGTDTIVMSRVIIDRTSTKIAKHLSETMQPTIATATIATRTPTTIKIITVVPSPLLLFSSGEASQ